ncbi:MAG TPA: hypothetical protein VF698_05525 [Thermoanaerobaculia bacterium]
MKRRTATFLAVAVLLTAAISIHAAPTNGTWAATLDEDNPGRVYFSINRGKWSQNGSTMETRDFANLTQSQINSATQTPVSFELRREAGTIAFEGVFKGGKGAGHFNFTPNRNYANTLKSMGLDLDDARRRHRDDDDDENDTLFQLAMHDVSTDFIRSMRAIGYDVPLDKYIAFRIFRVTPQLVEEFRQVGYDKLSADNLVAAQIHKATPKYIREMRAAGFTHLDFDDFISSRIHRVTPEFAEEMKRAGYGNLKYDDMMAFRIHGVTPEFIRALRELGYTNVDADDLVAMRIHRVTPEFIRELRTAGYSNVPVDKLVSMKIHGIDAKMMKAMRDAQ